MASMLDRVPLVSRSLRLIRTLAAQGLLLLDRVRSAELGREAEALRGQAQRFGAQAFGRVAARWPALSELVFGWKSDAITHVAAAAASERLAPLDRNAPLDAIEARALLVELTHGEAWQSRAAAATQLAFCEGKDVLAGLCAALRDVSAEVAVAAAEALGRKPEEAAVNALREALANHDGYLSPVTRVAALRALAGRLAQNERAPLLAALSDRDAEVSIAAIAVLKDRGDVDAAAAIMSLLGDTSGFFLPVVRLAATNALVQLGALDASVAKSLLERESDLAIRRVLERAAHPITT